MKFPSKAIPIEKSIIHVSLIIIKRIIQSKVSVTSLIEELHPFPIEMIIDSLILLYSINYIYLDSNNLINAKVVI